MIFYSFVSSPIGPVTLAEQGGALISAHLGRHPRADGQERETPLLKQAAKELAEYFASKRTRFTVPLAPKGTPFEQAVWQALQTIPYGHTLSYQDLALRAGHPRACRAAGSANGKNHLAIFIPCHRVIRADGSLGQYTGGANIKAHLLTLEKASFK